MLKNNNRIKKDRINLMNISIYTLHLYADILRNDYNSLNIIRNNLNEIECILKIYDKKNNYELHELTNRENNIDNFSFISQFTNWLNKTYIVFESNNLNVLSDLYYEFVRIKNLFIKLNESLYKIKK